MNLDYTRLIKYLTRMAERFNRSRDAATSFAVASAIRDELAEMVRVLDNNILPILRKSMIAHFEGGEKL